MNTWTPEMAKTSIVLAVLLMAIAVYVFRKDKAMMLVVCFLIFNGLIYQTRPTNASHRNAKQ